VVLLANDVWAAWAEEMRLAPEVWRINIRQFERSWTYRWAWIRKLRKAGFSIAIQPTYSRAILGGDSIVRATGAPVRIGSRGDLSNIPSWLKKMADKWYTQLIQAAPSQLMELRRNAEFMRGMGFDTYNARVGRIPRSKPYGRYQDIEGKRYAVLFPGASWSGRQWPVENFIEIGQRLVKRGIYIAVAGGKADYALSRALVDKLAPNVCDLVGKTSLPQLAELMRQAEVVITNETSAVHIAAAVQTPSICLVGGGHYGRFVPYDVDQDNSPMPTTVTYKLPCFGCNWRCRYPVLPEAAVKCVEKIGVDEVWGYIEKVVVE
jgi:ADP-heptose:LPS heptosyltransferase